MERRSMVRAGVITAGMAVCRRCLGAGLVAPVEAGGVGAPDAKEARSRALGIESIGSPVLFAGDAGTAYRDPAAVFHRGWFYLYFTLIRKEQGREGGTAGGQSYSYVAWSKSRDLRRWTPLRTLTPRDKALEYGSPGDVVWTGREWLLCLQTYPRPNGERYGNGDARLWTMRSADLERWSEPELLRVKGPDVSRAEMGRMIDPFLFRDKDVAGRWWCFYKQKGISMSRSEDLRTWTYVGRTDAGENPCVIVDRGAYVLFHSPANGIGIKRSRDLETWVDEGVITLGQKDWPWAAGRLTGGFVLDLRSEPGVGRAILFFHGSRFAEEDARGGFDNYASIGFAWSRDLANWRWAGSLPG